MRRIVLDMKNGLLAEAVTQSLSGCDMDFLIYRSPKPEETLALCRTCRANVLVMEVIRQGLWKLSERLRLCSAVRLLGWACKVLLLVDESTDELLASFLIFVKAISVFFLTTDGISTSCLKCFFSSFSAFFMTNSSCIIFLLYLLSSS